MDDGTRRLKPAHGAVPAPICAAQPGPIAVIGGGWAGLAAALTLAQAGYRVTVFEQGETLGGRARRVLRDGIALDNGQHLLIGAYRQTIALIEAVHGSAALARLMLRLPLTLAPFGAPRDDAVRLAAWRLPAPLHVAAALATARGLAWSERRALAASFRRLARARFRCTPGQTVTECFAATPRRIFAAVWSPLCVAALNTPPSRASAQVFANVLRETFAAPAAASDFLLPVGDLSALFPDAAARHVVQRGGAIRTGIAVRELHCGANDVIVRTGNGEERFAAVVVAVGPHQLALLADESHCAAVGEPAAWRTALAQVARFAYESITTAYIAYAAPVPFPAPIARLDDSPGHWAFDRGAALAGLDPKGARALVAVVVSGGGPHDAEDHAALGARVDAQLRRLAPALPPVLWTRVIAERRATYACTPALPRPRAGRVAPRLYLAGDYTDDELPPTLEAATRSGVTAARALADDIAHGLR